MPSDGDICATCQQTYSWHSANKPMHPFNEGQAGATAFLKPKRGESRTRDANASQRGSDGPAWPLDPVLRVALINKGLLTPQDLKDAEETIRVTTAEFQRTVRESRDGQSTEEARGREV